MSFPITSVLATRLARLRAALHDAGLDALVVSHSVNQRYLFNHVASAGMAVVGRDGVELLSDFRYVEAIRARQDSAQACPGLRTRLVPGSYDPALVEYLRTLDGPIGFEARHVSVATHAEWTRMLGEAARRLRPTERVVERLRAVKDEFELDCLRRAAAGLAQRGRRGLSRRASGRRRARRGGGDRGRDAGRRLRAAVVRDHRRVRSQRARCRTTVPATRRLEAGDLVVLDFGGVLDGYCSDLTRTVSVGPPSEEVRRLYAAVLAAQQAAIAAVGPGVEASAVDRAARAVLERCGPWRGVRARNRARAGARRARGAAAVADQRGHESAALSARVRAWS